MGLYIPPVTTPTETYTSDAGGTISIDLMRQRCAGFRARNVTELPYFSLMEFGGGPGKYAMRCPKTATLASPPPTSVLLSLSVPPSATTGPVNVHRCSEAPVGPEVSYMLWRQLNISGSGDVQFKLDHNPHGEPFCLTAVHDSGPTYNDELAVKACDATSNFQRWRWTSQMQLQSAMTRQEKDSVWAGRPGRCNGANECCLQVNGNKAVDGQVLQGGVCGVLCPGLNLPPQPGGAVTIRANGTGGQRSLDDFCIAFTYRMPQPRPRPPPPPPPPPPPLDPVQWHDPNEYLANRSLQAAVLRNEDGHCVNSPGWHLSFIMDCAEPNYLALLKEEARRHVAMLGDDFAGVSCDRGWPQLFNPFRDDGVSFCDRGHDGGKCASLLFSQQEVSKQVFGGIFQKAGKMISYNPVQIPRIDVNLAFDAIFTEMSSKSLADIFLVSSMALFKPATMWTISPPTEQGFAQLLLHGVYPMAPAPSGDHSLGLSGMEAFLHFGPMLRAMHGRRWNLTPYAIKCTAAAPSQTCVANIFDVPDGSLLAVVVLTGGASHAGHRQSQTRPPPPPPPPPPPATGTVSVKLAASLLQGRKVELLQVGRTSAFVAVASTAALHVDAGVIMIRYARSEPSDVKLKTTDDALAADPCAGRGCPNPGNKTGHSGSHSYPDFYCCPSGKSSDCGECFIDHACHCNATSRCCVPGGSGPPVPPPAPPSPPDSPYARRCNTTAYQPGCTCGAQNSTRRLARRSTQFARRRNSIFQPPKRPRTRGWRRQQVLLSVAPDAHSAVFSLGGATTTLTVGGAADAGGWKLLHAGSNPPSAVLQHDFDHWSKLVFLASGSNNLTIRKPVGRLEKIQQPLYDVRKTDPDYPCKQDVDPTDWLGRLGTNISGGEETNLVAAAALMAPNADAGLLGNPEEANKWQLRNDGTLGATPWGGRQHLGNLGFLPMWRLNRQSAACCGHPLALNVQTKMGMAGRYLRVVNLGRFYPSSGTGGGCGEEHASSVCPTSRSPCCACP